MSSAPSMKSGSTKSFCLPLMSSHRLCWVTTSRTTPARLLSSSFTHARQCAGNLASTACLTKRTKSRRERNASTRRSSLANPAANLERAVPTARKLTKDAMVANRAARRIARGAPSEIGSATEAQASAGRPVAIAVMFRTASATALIASASRAKRAI